MIRNQLKGVSDLVLVILLVVATIASVVFIDKFLGTKNLGLIKGKYVSGNYCQELKDNKNLLYQTVENFLKNITPLAYQIELKSIDGIEIKDDYCLVKYTAIITNLYNNKKYLLRDGIYIIDHKIITSFYDIETGKVILYMDKKIEEIVNITRSLKPEIKLFVMSKCPFGDRAENELLRFLLRLYKAGKIEFKPYYIVSEVNCSSNQGVKIGNKCFASMHGNDELKQDVRELCVLKEYGIEKYVDYVLKVNERCSLNNLLDCSRSIEKELGIDSNKIDECYNKYGENLLEESFEEAKKYMAFGSPTLVINGYKIEGLKSFEEYKKYICDAFEKEEDREFCDSIETNSKVAKTAPTAIDAACR